MKHSMRFTTALLALGLPLAGCATTTVDDASGTPSASPSAAGTPAAPAAAGYDLAPAVVMAGNADHTTVNPDEWDAARAVDVQLSGSGLVGSAAGSRPAGRRSRLTGQASTG